MRQFIEKDPAGQRAQGNLRESVPQYLEHLRQAGVAGADRIWRGYWGAFVAFKV